MFLFADIYYILLLAAIIPAAFLMYKIYQMDKADKEPVGLLIVLVLLGIISTGLAVITETFGSAYLDSHFVDGSFKYNFYMYFIVVACSEEGFKYLLLRFKTWKHPAFNYMYDGIVYAVFVSLGFALWENIEYVLSYGFSTAMVRAVTAVPGHACFGVFMGIYYGMAKKYQHLGDEAKSKRYRILAFVVPVLMHGCYDFIATGTSGLSTLIFIVFVCIMFYISHKRAKSISSHDQYLGENNNN